MHPLLLSRTSLTWYLTFWLLVGAMLAALLTEQGGLDWRFATAAALPLAIVFSFVCLSAWYVARGMPLSRTGTVRVAITAVTAALISSSLWLVVAGAWFAVLSRRMRLPDPGATFGGVQTLLFGFGVLLYLLSLAVSYLLAVYEASREAERRGLQVQVLAREAELRSLRAQIDPHFLFNSLHSISALTSLDAAAARRMCLLLGDFLRESLALGAEQRIPLERELALLERFLAIERVRFGDRLATDISVGDAAGCQVAPLLLQPIVENAVTHGIAHLVEGGVVRVAAARQGSVLRIVVENPCDPERPRRGGGGVGLANVRARLRALHGGGATLTAREQAAVWRVEVTMPVVEAMPG